MPGANHHKPALHPSDQQSNHSYEEIAASEVASEVRQLLRFNFETSLLSLGHFAAEYLRQIPAT